jgi:hypothetical protein
MTDDRGWSDEEQLVQYLVEFGFNRNEARIYLAALGRPPLRVAELAELADVNRPKAYDALRQLVEKGLFEPEGGGQEPARFQATDPMLVVQRLRHQSALEQADRVQDTSLLVADLFARYYEAPQGDDPFEYVELIRNSDAAWARRDAITAGAEKEVVQARRMTRPGPARRSGSARASPTGCCTRPGSSTSRSSWPGWPTASSGASRSASSTRCRWACAPSTGASACSASTRRG